MAVGQSPPYASATHQAPSPPMKKTEVEVISSDTVKPSSPTPPLLRRYPLSFLDQISPPVYMPLLLFFSHPLAPDALLRLKHSLSHTLTRYYPLAGRIRDNTFIDCDDDGVLFLEARTSSHLSALTTESICTEELNRFLPLEVDSADDLPLAVQATAFNCGGLALGLCFSHKVADALSLLVFITAWATMARGDPDAAPRPRFDSATLFPPRNLSGFAPRTGITENIVARRYVFSATAIEVLRERYSDRGARPTRVEALSAFIWTRFAAATICEGGRPGPVQHAVNLRTRMEPQLPESSFGNYYRIAVTAAPGTAETDGREIVGEIRKVLRGIDGEYVRRLRDGEEHLRFIKERAERFKRGEVVSFSFTSLCRFPLYEEADFGWGAAEWVTSARLPFRNLVSFMDAKRGGGVEVWVNLTEEDMAKFEKDEKFKEFASQTH
ncbi:stemmadenine O-acetyltransferase-like [Malania oleifera]|uniref:stemmadenine O-acetyltransferase-like n=1 Tax=Malania oleifera TaxID=397392 RepID=UPI0025AEAA54|nr:stemmadenine O-acetyltransferase-like [Malania oleifera]